LDDYQTSATTVFTPVSNGLANALTISHQFREDLLSIVNNVTALSNQLTLLINTVSNVNQTGYLDQTNCAFMGLDLRVLLDYTCNDFAPSLYAIAWIAGVIGVLGLFTTLAMFCLATKIIHQRRYGLAGADGKPENQPPAQPQYPPPQPQYPPPQAGGYNNNYGQASPGGYGYPQAKA